MEERDNPDVEIRRRILDVDAIDALRGAGKKEQS